MTVTMINCANMAASGILIRGKRITDEWQVHAEGCRDLKEMRGTFGRYMPDAFQIFQSVDDARTDFNAEMGDGGTGGFGEGEGWDFDRDVTVKPCCK